MQEEWVLTVRIVLIYVSQYGSWSGCSIDVQTAFLHTPVSGGVWVDDRTILLIVVKPRAQALYGLQTSPTSWSTYRDQQLRKMKVDDPMQATWSVTDENLRFLKADLGVVFVLALFGEKAHVEALVKEIQGL